jgi:hypothetical protein
MEDVGVFYVCAFGLFYGHLIFLLLEKSGNPGSERSQEKSNF